MGHNYQSFFFLLNPQKGDRSNGVLALAAERSHWLVDPDHLLRAARHYEGAAQILIRQAVMSAREVSQHTILNSPRPPRHALPPYPPLS